MVSQYKMGHPDACYMVNPRNWGKSLCDIGWPMKECAYQKSLKITKGLQEHSPTWMEMMKRRKRRKKVL